MTVLTLASAALGASRSRRDQAQAGAAASRRQGGRRPPQNLQVLPKDMTSQQVHAADAQLHGGAAASSARTATSARAGARQGRQPEEGHRAQDDPDDGRHQQRPAEGRRRAGGRRRRRRSPASPAIAARSSRSTRRRRRTLAAGVTSGHAQVPSRSRRYPTNSGTRSHVLDAQSPALGVHQRLDARARDEDRVRAPVGREVHAGRARRGRDRGREGAASRRASTPSSRASARTSRSIDEAKEVFDHYMKVIDLVKAAGLDAQISIKPTQLGYDQNPDVCYDYCIRLLERCEATGNFFWLDMESSPYVDGTIALFKRLRAKSDEGRHRDPGVPLPDREGHRGARRAGIGDSAGEGRVPRAGRPSRTRRSPTWTRTTSSSRRACCRTTTRGRARCCTSRRTTSASRRGCSRSSPSARSPQSRYEFAMLFGIQTGRQQELGRAGHPRRAASSATANTGSPGTCAGSPNGPRTSGSSSRTCSGRQVAKTT